MMFKGVEVRKLVLVSTLCCVLLIVSVSFYLILSSRSSLRKETDEMKTAMAEQIAGHLQDAYASMEDFLKNSEGIGFGSDVASLLQDRGAVYDFTSTSIMRSYDADFVVLYSGNKVQASAAKPGTEIPAEIRPGIAGDEEYVILNELGGRKGTFLVMDKPGIFPGDELIYAIDNTTQIAAIKQAYEDEKSRAINRQVAGVSILFLLLLVLSLAVIYFSITRWLGRPISRLSEEARSIARGESPPAKEVREASIFANLQRLVNSGRVILVKGGAGSAAGGGTEKPVEQREINKVIATWAVITTLIFLASTIILLIASVTIMNSKAEKILENVDREMADYYSSCYDSIIAYTLSSPSVYIGGELWDPNAVIDREATINRLVNLVKAVFNCDLAVGYIEPEGVGKYVTSGEEGVQLKKPLLTEMGDSISIHEGYYREGDLVMVLMNISDYPGFGDGQFAYYVIDITPQANVLEDLYDSGSNSLLKTQILLSLLFLLLCLVLSPLAMAWATMKYVTRPILELDALSARLMEGELDEEIVVDERSAFADIQRLLKQAQELLKTMAEGI